MAQTDNEMMNERYGLVTDRIRETLKEDALRGPLLSFFRRTSEFVVMLSDILDRTLSGGTDEVSTAALKSENHKLYEDILPENYSKSFADPDYITSEFSKADIPEAERMARYLCFLYTEMRGLIPIAYEGKTEIFTIFAELYVQVYSCFRLAALDGSYLEADSVRDIIYSFESDNCDIIIPDSIADRIDPSRDFVRKIVCGADLSDERFLYLTGEYVTDN